MSLFTPVNAQCPACGTENELQVVGSVNADRRPDLRRQILDRTFQAATCTHCATKFRLPPLFTYVDFERNQWIQAHPSDEVAAWEEHEKDAQEIFDAVYGADAPEAAQEIGQAMNRRLTFGWPAVTEKLLCGELGLDDVTLELLKIAVLRSVPRPPLADGAELRLERAEDGKLVLSWMISATEARLNSLRIPRDVYDDIAGDAAWAELRHELTGHMFVDMNRLLIPA
jgi:hypothetical protein